MSTAPRAHNLRVVISAEANAYLAWQAKLAHYSCVSRLGQTPLIVVHEGDGGGSRDWSDITAAGGTLLHAPSYRATPSGAKYACRNAAGTLLEAAGALGPDVQLLLLCDPDIVFARPFEVETELSGSSCEYLDYAQAPVRAAMRRLGITPPEEALADGGNLSCGTPYIIPRECARTLAGAWLKAIDAFGRPRWEDNMYAFGLAVLMLGLELIRIPLADTNYYPHATVQAPIVHYCYDNELWSKRQFASNIAANRVWTPPRGAVAGSVLAEVLQQLAEARSFFARLGEGKAPQPAQSGLLSSR